MLRVQRTPFTQCWCTPMRHPPHIRSQNQHPAISGFCFQAAGADGDPQTWEWNVKPSLELATCSVGVVTNTTAPFPFPSANAFTQVLQQLMLANPVIPAALVKLGEACHATNSSAEVGQLVSVAGVEVGTGSVVGLDTALPSQSGRSVDCRSRFGNHPPVSSSVQ